MDRHQHPATRSFHLGIPSFFVISVVFSAPHANAQQPPAATIGNQLEADQVFSRGVEAFRQGRYEDAQRFFARAKELNPALLNAYLYLATAYASQYIPGAPSDENKRLGAQAAEEFQRLLAIEPGNLSAIDGIGSILFQMAGAPFDAAKLEESKLYHQKHIQLRPGDPEPYYWVGVIDWTLAFRANGEIRHRFNAYAGSRKQLQDTDPLPSDLLVEYARDFGPIIEEGIQHMQKAISLRPDYDDAMAYLSLLYRRKADTVESAAERQHLSDMADSLIDKIKEMKQKHIEQQPDQN